MTRANNKNHANKIRNTPQSSDATDALTALATELDAQDSAQDASTDAQSFLRAVNAHTTAYVDDAQARMRTDAQDAQNAQTKRAQDAQSTEDAIRALCADHFGSDYAKLIRTLVRSVPTDVRNKALFRRTWNADRSAVNYDLCGTRLTIARNASGKWITNGITDSFVDGNGNEHRMTYGDASSKEGQLEEERAARNALAGWRMYVLRTITAREEVTRVANVVQSSAVAKLAERAQTEAQEARTEAQEARAEAQALKEQLSAILARLDAQDSKQSA